MNKLLFRQKKEEKTNVCRILDQKKAVYTFRRFDTQETNGVALAALLGQDPNRVFKTLVTVGTTKEHYVFVIPVCNELNLKSATTNYKNSNREERIEKGYWQSIFSNVVNCNKKYMTLRFFEDDNRVLTLGFDK